MFQSIRLVCVLAATAAALAAQPAIPTTLANVRTTGMIGIADGQTARLNLLNPGVQAPLLGIICTATVSFLDGDGGLLKSATFSVIPGKSLSLDLHSDTDLNIVAGDRREIRAVISIPNISIIPPPPATTPTPIAAAASCTVVPTLEILDTASGRTLVTLGHTVNVP